MRGQGRTPLHESALLDWPVDGTNVTILMEELNCLSVKMKWLYFSNNCQLMAFLLGNKLP